MPVDARFPAQPAPGFAVRRSPVKALGRAAIRSALSYRGAISFALTALGATIARSGVAPAVVRPLVHREVVRSGLRLLPLTLFLAVALGLVVVGQAVALLTRVGARDLVGLLMVTAIVRELGPLVAAMLVLAKAGTTNVIELGTARAQGEIEALEALGIDPIRYLVVPRLVGTAVAVVALSVYLVVGALAGGFAVAFAQNIPLTLNDYLGQLGGALQWLDFIVPAIKAMVFGILIALITCHHGLSKPRHIEDVPHATIQAVIVSVVACVLADAVAMLPYYIR